MILRQVRVQDEPLSCSKGHSQPGEFDVHGPDRDELNYSIARIQFVASLEAPDRHRRLTEIRHGPPLSASDYAFTFDSCGHAVTSLQRVL